MVKYFVRVSVITTICAYIYIFMEWLFFVTKPSFLSMQSIFTVVSLLFTTPLILVIFGTLVISFVGVLSIPKRLQIPKTINQILFIFTPSFIIATIFFLLIDNFTYTIFRFSIGQHLGLFRYVYALLFILLFLWVFKILKLWVESLFWDNWGQMVFIIVGVLFSLSVCATAAKYITIKAEMQVVYETTGENQRSFNIESLPNILIFSPDGLDATHMSIYGYPRETTPFIKSLSSESMIFENHFSNSNTTTASVGSLLSGKLSTRTKVVYDTDIFTGIDSFQHLPGVLRGLGYWNIDLSVRYWADPYDLNMRDSFQVANGRWEQETQWGIWLPKSVRSVFLLETYFLEKTMDRVGSRLKHAFGIADMDNPLSEVLHYNGRKESTLDRISELIDIIDKTKAPFFAHVHLLDTHGPRFHIKKQIFSKGSIEEYDWMDDFFDDAILEFDNQVREVVNHLREKDLFDNTLIIFISDHGSKWRSEQRIPLIIRFPHHRYKGRITRNVQSIDIAPTILDYLGVEIPDWMDGESLLSERKGAYRPIIGTDKNNDIDKCPENYKEPFFGLGGVFAVVCDRYYKLSVWENQLTSRTIEGHTSPCNETNLPSVGEVREIIVDHLGSSGYDVSSLR